MMIGRLKEDALIATRRQAAERFAVPKRRDEAWRFTDLRTLEKSLFPPARPGAAVPDAALAAYRTGEPAQRVVLVNGRVVASEGAHVATLRDRLDLVRDSDELGPFATLNTAFVEDGVVVTLPEGASARIEVLHWGAAEAEGAYARVIVELGAGAEATLVESFAGTGAYFGNTVASIRLGAKARLRHVKLQDEAAEAVHLGAVKVDVGPGAAYDAFILMLGARLSRHDLVACLAEEAQCVVNGAYLLRGQQEATIATFIDHAAPAARTGEVVKGVVDDRAHGVFQGKIRVRPDAQKTDAHQLNRNLLLSPRAAVDTKPELEIHADDVKCSHGATVGDLDEAQLFYLRARGIPEAEARRMLIEAFAIEAVELVGDAPARAYLERHLGRWLEAGR
jgi:Fe-S cluster assembly protein SufD